MSVSVIQRKDCLQHASYREFFAFKRDSARAFTFSVLFHAVVMGFFLYMFASETLLPVINERLQVIQVTWVDASRFSNKDSHAVHPEKLQSPAAAIQQISNSRKEQLLPEKPMILSAPEEKKPAVVPNNAAGEHLPVADKPIARGMQTDIESKPIATPEYDSDNCTANTSKAKPRYRENTPPPYPLSARLKGYEGITVIAAEILTDGRAGNLKIKSSSGYGILDQSAVAAVKTWKFDPAREMGKPVSTWVEIPIRFILKSSH